MKINKKKTVSLLNGRKLIEIYLPVVTEVFSSIFCPLLTNLSFDN